jgi:hypothetical protein
MLTIAEAMCDLLPQISSDEQSSAESKHCCSATRNHATYGNRDPPVNKIEACC